MNQNQPIIITACFATKTRLMGVVAGYITYTDIASSEASSTLTSSDSTPQDQQITEFYHIEFEEYGLDRFEQLIDPTEYDIKQMTQAIFGGLGGPLIAIEPSEFLQLIIGAHAINAASEDFTAALQKSPWLKSCLGQPHPFAPHLFAHATDLVCEELRSPFELIHYFLMRYLGHDAIYLRYAPMGHPYLETRYTLMRNQLERLDDDRYHFSALVLAEDYAVIEGEILLTEGIVEGFDITAHVPVSDIEAAMMLRKKEYIYLYDVDSAAVEELLTQEHKYLNPTPFKNGRLYTCYRSHNNHVNAKIFYLNGDVEALLYFTDSNQLLLASDDLKAMIKWDDLLLNRFGNDLGGDLEKYEEWDFESPILYNFIDSDFVDFDDFLAYEPINE